MEEYLKATAVIDWRDTQILALAKDLAGSETEDQVIAKRVFEWVRDQVQHCTDYDRDEVTCRASDVLTIRTGFCYAKSHLVAALMRANGIPTGFCYQRLSIDGVGAPFSLHGLNAVLLRDHGWYRIDARGNKPQVCAEFSPPEEKLAFPISCAGEADLPEVWPDPLPMVVAALESAESVRQLRHELPDIPIIL